MVSEKKKKLENFLNVRKLKIVEKISKGYSSEVFLLKNSSGKKFALKVEKKKSSRINLVQKEVSNLSLANSKKIGPKLIAFEKIAGIILMEFIEGVTFNEWLFEKNPSKKQMKKFTDNLLVQVQTLDKIGLDHGQLAGRGTNILVRKGMPIIIDFEKASQMRNCHNENQIKSFLFENPHSTITKRVRKILEFNN